MTRESISRAINPATLVALLASRSRRSSDKAELTPAAVLIGLMQVDDDVHFLLTRRTDSVETHKGQVAFPGGMIEGDETPIEAAIREAEEEIGLQRKDITIIGMLDDMNTPTGFRVTPVIALVDAASAMHPNADEVARIFTVPIRYFLDAKNERTEERFLSGEMRTIFIYEYDGEMIWGVTAFIIKHFIDVVMSV